MVALRLSRETVQESPKIVTLRIAGDVDYLNVPGVERAFAEVLETDRPRHVLLDLRELTFVVTPFLGSLLFWKEEVARRGGKLALFGATPSIADTLRVIRLDRVLPLWANQQDALADLPTDSH
jgi:stage II sporulation protein AA (anti-sigma F factor antagonist)